MRRALLLVIATLLVVAACAGRDFKPPPSASFPVLGRTTRGELLVTYGKPLREGAASMNGVALELLTYSYAQSGSEAVAPRVTPARSVTFALHEGVIVSYVHTSSFKSDATLFDASQATQLVKGQSRREDVTRLFGPPSGQAIPPAVDAKHRATWIYSYAQTIARPYQSPLIYQQRLRVSFDEQGIVQDYELFTHGDRG